MNQNGVPLADAAAMERTPRIPFALTVGVTGHRLDAIPAEARGPLEARIAEALALLEEQARLRGGRDAGLFTDAPPAFTLVSPLADGTDQMAAEAALARGWRLQAVLPFDRSSYLGDFPNAAQREQFEGLLGKAESVLELPGDPDDRLDAYVMAGRATVAHCDLLIAVWDGLPPRGRGGTGEIVDLAVARGTPIVHVPVDPGQPPVILWAAFDPNVLTRNGWDRGARRPFEAAQVERLLSALLAPPPDAGELRFYDRFLGERSRRIRGRLEYPLLLALAGIARLDSSKWRESRCAAAIEEDGDASWKAAATGTACPLRLICCSAPMAGATGWPAITPRPFAAAMCSISCSPRRLSCSACPLLHCRHPSWSWRSSNSLSRWR